MLITILGKLKKKLGESINLETLLMKASPAPELHVTSPEWPGAGDFFHTLVNILPGAISATHAYAIITKDLDGVITSWNAGATKLFGYTANEAIGTKLPDFVPADCEREELEMLDRLRRGQAIDHYYTVRRHKDGHLVDVSLTFSPVKDDDGRVIGMSKIIRDISGSKRAKEQEWLVVDELKHRLKNTYAMVEAIARRTLRGATAAELAAFSARLHALAHASELLHLQSWERTSLEEIVAQALAVFKEAHADRLSYSGPSNAYLDANKALLLALALHELATNAVKHGALSNESGTISITWELVDSDQPILRLFWRETGGPAVEAPKVQGFGLRLMERGLAAGLGRSHLEFKPEGLDCSLDIVV